MSLGLWSQSKMWFGSLICCRAWSIWKTSWSTCLSFFLWNWQSGTPNSIFHNYRMFSQILGGRRPPVEWWRQGMSATQKRKKTVANSSSISSFPTGASTGHRCCLSFFSLCQMQVFLSVHDDTMRQKQWKTAKTPETQWKKVPSKVNLQKWKKCIEIGQCQSYSLIQEIHRGTWLELLRSFEIWVCWLSQISPVKEKQRQPRPGQHRSTMSSVSMTSVSFRDAKIQKNATHILSSAGHCAKNDWQIYANIRSQLQTGMWDSEPKTNCWARGLQHPFSKCFGRDWLTALESPSIFIGFLQKLSLIRPSSTKSDSPRQFDVSCLLYIYLSNSWVSTFCAPSWWDHPQSLSSPRICWPGGYADTQISELHRILGTLKGWHFLSSKSFQSNLGSQHRQCGRGQHHSHHLPRKCWTDGWQVITVQALDWKILKALFLQVSQISTR